MSPPDAERRPARGGAEVGTGDGTTSGTITHPEQAQTLFDVVQRSHAYGRTIEIVPSWQVDDDEVAVVQGAPLQQARDEQERAIRAVERAASAWDRSVIDRAIAETGKRLAVFSANDVRPLLPEVRRALIGARFMAAAKAGRMTAVGYVKSTDKATHASTVALWRWVG